MYFHVQKKFRQVRFFKPSHQRVEKVQRRKGRCSKNGRRTAEQGELPAWTPNPRLTRHRLHATPPADTASRMRTSFPGFPKTQNSFVTNTQTSEEGITELRKRVWAFFSVDSGEPRIFWLSPVKVHPRLNNDIVMRPCILWLWGQAAQKTSRVTSWVPWSSLRQGPDPHSNLISGMGREREYLSCLPVILSISAQREIFLFITLVPEIWGSRSELE